MDFPAAVELGPCYDVMFLPTVDDVILGERLFPFLPRVSISALSQVGVWDLRPPPLDNGQFLLAS